MIDEAQGETVASVEVRADEADGHHRLPALDGIRGLAILLVLITHNLILDNASPLDRIVRPFLYGAWVGVDLFFVLSGFLITGILWDAKESHHYFRNFYMRRVLRIFPLYYLVVTAAFLIASFIHTTYVQTLMGQPGHPIWYYLYLNNMYHGASGRSPMLEVSWSLAVEEQFYFIWPTVVLLCSRRRLMQICGLLIVAALGTRVGLHFAGVDPIWNYTFIFSRADALAVGAWIALAIRGNGGIRLIVRMAWGAVAFAFVWTAMILILKKTSLWSPGVGIALWFTPLQLMFGALLVSALTATKGMMRYHFFTLRPLRMAGKLSYAMYLLHRPIVVALRDDLRLQDKIPRIAGSELPSQLVFYTISISLTFLVGWISWHLYEKRFLQLKHYFPRTET